MQAAAEEGIVPGGGVALLRPVEAAGNVKAERLARLSFGSPASLIQRPILSGVVRYP